MSEFFFKCQHCGANITAEDSMIGQTCSCPACENTITVKRPTKVEKQSVNKTVAQTQQPISPPATPQQPPQKPYSESMCREAIILGIIMVIIGLLVVFFGPFPILLNIPLMILTVLPLQIAAWILQKLSISIMLQRKQLALLDDIKQQLRK